MTSNFSKNAYKLLCVLIILGVAAIRIHLASIPFERDEGEYAYAGQMILHGVPPYQEVYNMKFPGVYFMYSLAFKLFGEGVPAARYLTLLLQLIGAGFIFLLARRVINPLAGWLAAAMFMLFNLTLALQGIMCNAEHFVVAFLVPSFFFLYRGMEEESAVDIVIAGILTSTACLMKQHAIVFAISGAVWIIYTQRVVLLKSIGNTGFGFPFCFIPRLWAGRGRKRGRLLATRQSANVPFKYLFAYAIGGIIPVFLMALYLYQAGVWDHFYFLTIQYAREYASAVPLGSGISQLNPANHDTSTWSPLLVWFIVISVIGLLLPGTGSKTRLFLFVLLLASGLAVCPGFLFRRHYFLLMIPVFALLFTNTAFLITRYFGEHLRYVMLSLFIIANAAFFMFYQRDCFFKLPPESVTEKLYPGTPFSISGEVAAFIKQRTLPNDRICMLGAEPQLFFLSQRRSASGYIYIYPMLERQKYADTMTSEFIAETEQHKPAMLVYSSKSVFEDGYNKDSRLYKWFDTYKSQYKLAAIYAPKSASDMRIVAFDTIAPIDTLSELIPQIKVYQRIAKP